MPQTGQYLHDENGKVTLKFGDRTFSLILSTAYDVGIIGPEVNGIAILDEDNLCIVFDQYLNTSSHVTIGDQSREFNRIKGMDWQDFRKVCLNNFRLRAASAPEMHQFAPNAVFTHENRIILSTEDRPENRPVENYPLSGREEIIAFLSSHSVHRQGNMYTPWQLAWNIKVHSADEMGKGVADYPVDGAFDERWKEHLAENEDMFWNCANEALEFMTDGDYAKNSRAAAGGWDFSVAGRSGGWLLLSDTDFGDFKFSNKSNMIELMRDFDDKDLADLYVMTCEVDRITDTASQQVTQGFAMRRSEMESEWGNDIAFKI